MLALLFVVGCDHWADLYSSSVSSNANQLAAACGRYNLCVWDIHSGKLNRRIRDGYNWFSAVAFSPANNFIASGGSDASVTLWNAETGAKFWKFTAPPRDSWVFALKFSDDGKKLAAGGMDWPVRILDVETGKLIAQLASGSQPINGLSFAPDNATLATVGGDGSVRVFDVGSGKLKFQMESGATHAVAFSPDGKLLATGSVGLTVDLWEAGTGKSLASMEATGKKPLTPGFSSIAFSPQGERIAAGTGRAIWVWDAESGLLITTIPGGGRDIYFSSDGKSLISGGADSIIRIWDLAGAREIRHFSCYHAVRPWN